MVSATETAMKQALLQGRYQGGKANGRLARKDGGKVAGQG